MFWFTVLALSPMKNCGCGEILIKKSEVTARTEGAPCFPEMPSSCLEGKIVPGASQTPSQGDPTCIPPKDIFRFSWGVPLQSSPYVCVAAFVAVHVHFVGI